MPFPPARHRVRVMAKSTAALDPLVPRVQFRPPQNRPTLDPCSRNRVIGWIERWNFGATFFTTNQCGRSMDVISAGPAYDIVLFCGSACQKCRIYKRTHAMDSVLLSEPQPWNRTRCRDKWRERLSSSRHGQTQWESRRIGACTCTLSRGTPKLLASWDAGGFERRNYSRAIACLTETSTLYSSLSSQHRSTSPRKIRSSVLTNTDTFDGSSSAVLSVSSFF
jgi:hypothetical protein